MVRNFVKLLVAALLLPMPALNAHACMISLKPETSGFFLNPTLQKVVVVKASPTPDKPCVLLLGDELLQVNDRVIPGAKAKDVMAYWKALPKGSKPAFQVRRSGEILSVVGK